MNAKLTYKDEYDQTHINLSAIHYLKRKDTSNYSISDIANEIEECRQILFALGLIPDPKFPFSGVSYNTRAKQRLGQTCYSNGYYSFNFNATYFQVAKPETVHSTIMHEVIHTAPRCMNHGEKWSFIAKRINQELAPLGILVVRKSKSPEYAAKLEADGYIGKKAVKKYTYGLYCPKCKKITHAYQRKCKTWTEIESGIRYWHGNYKEHTLQAVMIEDPELLASNGWRM